MTNIEADLSLEQPMCGIEKSKRSRVNGSNPKRKELVPFLKIATIPEELIRELELILENDNKNYLGSDEYGISQQCDFEKVFKVEDKYRQVLLQLKPSDNSSLVDEFAYTEWDERVSEQLRMELSKFFENVFRFRLSEMKPLHALNYHIDSDTSVMCRAQICINPAGSVFDIKIKGKEYSLNMQRGDLCFVNTGWPHRVRNGNGIRRVSVFGFKFNELDKDIQQLLLIQS